MQIDVRKRPDRAQRAIAVPVRCAFVACAVSVLLPSSGLRAQSPPVNGQWANASIHDTTTNFPLPCLPLTAGMVPTFNAIEMGLIPKPGRQGWVFVMDQADPVAGSPAAQRYALIDFTTTPPTYINRCFQLPGPNQKTQGQPDPPGDFFCGHQVWNRDGNLVVFGGTLYYPGTTTQFDGSNLVYIWDPATDVWTPQTPLAQRRYYPTVFVGETLATDGLERYIVAGGLDVYANYPRHPRTTPPNTIPSSDKVYKRTGATSATPDMDANQNRIYAGPQQIAAPSESGDFYWYPHMFRTRNGRMFMTMFALNSGNVRHNPLVINPPWDYQAGTWPVQQDDAHFGSSVLLPIDCSNLAQTADRYVRLGGGVTFGPDEVTNPYGPPVPSSTVEASGAAMGNTWFPLQNLLAARMHCNAVLMADGNLLILGGDHTFSPSTPGQNTFSEIRDTQTGARIQTPSMDPRGYHSTAVLLPDGRVVYRRRQPPSIGLSGLLASLHVQGASDDHLAQLHRSDRLRQHLYAGCDLCRSEGRLHRPGRADPPVLDDAPLRHRAALHPAGAGQLPVVADAQVRVQGAAGRQCRPPRLVHDRRADQRARAVGGRMGAAPVRRLVHRLLPAALLAAAAAGQAIVWQHVGIQDLTRVAEKLAVIGDVDGDGYRDLVVEFEVVGPPLTKYQLWTLSGKDGRVLRVRDNLAGYFNLCLASAGDFDGDGIGDYVVMLRDLGVTSLRVEVRSGRDERLLLARDEHVDQRHGNVASGRPGPRRRRQAGSGDDGAG